MKAVILALALALTVGVTLAQETTPEPASPPTTGAVTVSVGNPYRVTVPNDEALVAYVGETIVTPHGQFARLIVFGNEADAGLVQLTPCDNIAITCQPLTVRAEGVNQGDVFVLTEAGDGAS